MKGASTSRMAEMTSIPGQEKCSDMSDHLSWSFGARGIDILQHFGAAFLARGKGLFGLS